MNDVVFLMTNSRLARKKPSRNTADYSFEDLDSDEEWIVEDKNMMKSLEEFNTLIDVNLARQEDGGIGGGMMGLVMEFSSWKRERGFDIHHLRWPELGRKWRRECWVVVVLDDGERE
ncbi:hypothetical protein HN51_007946 [Arachis hypogaea]